MLQNTLVIHDIALPPAHKENTLFFFAGNKTVRCKGCFGCWLKTPGECVMHDGSEHIGSIMLQSKEVWIFSKILYGGFSVEIKRVLDRCIPGILPFFTWRHHRMHHCPRYPNRPVFHVVFYHADTATEKEKLLAEKNANAVAVNMNCSGCTVTFLRNVPAGWEVLKK